jgi:hypothetical protein
MWFVLGILRVKWRMSCEVESPLASKFRVLAKRTEQYLSAEIEKALGANNLTLETQKALPEPANPWELLFSSWSHLLFLGH